MNSLIRLWNVIAGLAESLARTKELIDAGNARVEQSLGLDAPPVKLLTVDVDAPVKRKKEAA